MKDSSWTLEAIVNQTTLRGILSNLETPVALTDSVGRWDIANNYGVFNFYSDIIKYNTTRFQYLKACLDTSLSENVQLIEFRRSGFRNLWYFNSTDNTRGILTGKQEVDMILRFKSDYLEKNPSFIDFNFLLYTGRGQSKVKNPTGF